jgi:hypothetical protein
VEEPEFKAKVFGSKAMLLLHFGDYLSEWMKEWEGTDRAADISKTASVQPDLGIETNYKGGRSQRKAK